MNSALKLATLAAPLTLCDLGDASAGEPGKLGLAASELTMPSEDGMAATAKGYKRHLRRLKRQLERFQEERAEEFGLEGHTVTIENDTASWRGGPYVLINFGRAYSLEDITEDGFVVDRAYVDVEKGFDVSHPDLQVCDNWAYLREALQVEGADVDVYAGIVFSIGDKSDICWKTPR